MIGNISSLFTTRRAETKQHLINFYSNEEIVAQIISDPRSSHSKASDEEKELSKILDLTLDQTIDHSRRQLIKEIQRNLKDIPFGQVLISAAVLSSILTSYLTQKENQIKPKQEQAQEILYIIGKIFLKTNATQIIKSFIPGVSELVEAVVSVATAKSSLNPLHTDQKIGKAVASVAGGAIGGVIGTAVPIIGTYIGTYVGAVVSKTAATRFYQVLEAWQKAPRGSKSIIPQYSRSYFTLIDNDAKNILDPLYHNYLATEYKSKMLGDEIAKWLCINTLLQNSNDKISEECLEIINEEMNRLNQEFINLKNNHGRISLVLSSKTSNNSARVIDYKTEIKECLLPLHQPIISMLNEYFSPSLKATSKSKATPLVIDLSLEDAYGISRRPLAFFDSKITAPPGITRNGQLIESDFIDYPYFSTAP